MRILLTQNTAHFPAYGGGGAFGQILLEQLATRGHTCHIVAPLRRTTIEQHRAHLTARGAQIWSVSREAVVYEYGGVVGHAVANPSHLARYIASTAERVSPHWTLVPSDDPRMIVLSAASKATPGRVVYLAHTLQYLPFGPGSICPSTAGTRMIQGAAGVVAVSKAAQSYLYRWGKVPSALIHPQIYGTGPFPRYGDPASGAVTMLNPCGVKGLPIFLALADAYPRTPFLAVPGPGTGDADLEAMRRRANIRLADPAQDIDAILARTRVLVMPSLWDEAFGHNAVEAMLRGVPVLASAVGGLPEVKLGVPYLLPVRRIVRYEPGARGRRAPVVPEQDPRRWLAALHMLLNDPEHYAEVSAWSREAAAGFVASLDEQAPEQYLSDLLPIDQPSPRAGRISPAAALTPERRAALAGILAARSAARTAALTGHAEGTSRR